MLNPATKRYIELVANIQENLNRLQTAADEHFYADPDNIHRGDVGTIESISNQLKEICNRVFQEGEYSE